MMKKKILFGLSALMGLMMINSGLNKFLNFMPMPEMPKEAGALMMAFAESGWLLPLIALAEIVGGILFIAPKFRALGAIVLLPVTVTFSAFTTMIESPQSAFGVNSGLCFPLNLVATKEANLPKFRPSASITNH